MPVPSDPQLNAIRTQVEFYFGLENLMQDAFLLSRMNSRMMVPLSTIFSFKKIRQLSTNFDSVLAAVQLSPAKLVVERDPTDGEWWIGPDPQAAPNSGCTVILSGVNEEVCVEDIEGLTEAPLLHSYNFANGTWYATYQDRASAKVALGDMQGKLLKGSPVKAHIKVDTVSKEHSASTLNKNATPYLVPGNGMRSPNHMPRTAQWLSNPKASPVAGCPLYVSRNPVLASQRPEGEARNVSPMMSTFYSMSPVQQQMFMMNMMLRQQMMMQGGRRDDAAMPPFQLSDPNARPYTDRPGKRNPLAPIGDDLDENETRRKFQQPERKSTGTQKRSNEVSARIEALGADIGENNCHTGADTKRDCNTGNRPNHTPLPAMNPTNFPTLGGDVPASGGEAKPLSGWAAAVSKSKPAPEVVKETKQSDQIIPNSSEGTANRPPKSIEDSYITPTPIAHVVSKENQKTTPPPQKPNSSQSQSQQFVDEVREAEAPRTYASMLAKKAVTTR